MELIRVLYCHCRRKIGFVHRAFIFSIFKQEIKIDFYSINQLAVASLSLSLSPVRNIVLTWRFLKKSLRLLEQATLWSSRPMRVDQSSLITWLCRERGPTQPGWGGSRELRRPLRSWRPAAVSWNSENISTIIWCLRKYFSWIIHWVFQSMSRTVPRSYALKNQLGPGSLWHMIAGSSNTLILLTNESQAWLDLDQWEWRTPGVTWSEGWPSLVVIWLEMLNCSSELVLVGLHSNQSGDFYQFF